VPYACVIDARPRRRADVRGCADVRSIITHEL
jgi:hypothetical protein